MKLYLLRHGKAVRDHEECTRPLAPRGERQVAAQGESMRQRGLQVDRVLYSPKLRARQTMEIFCSRALPDTPREMTDWMLPADAVEPWLPRLAEAQEDLLLVGHNFFMEDLAQLLVGRPVRFKTSTLGAFERDAAGLWSMLWLEHPPK